MHRAPLPPPLARSSFGVPEARAAGIARSRTRAADLASPRRGVRVPIELDASAEQRVAPLLGGDRWFSHVSAARLWGCPLPPGLPAEAHVTARGRAPRIAGVRGHSTLARPSLRLRRGLPVTDAAATFLALAELLPFDELVVCGDHLVHDPPKLDPAEPERPHKTIARIEQRARGHCGRGARAARRALDLLSTGAESRPETLLRLLLLRAGLTGFVVNPDVSDARGRWLARCDLVFFDRMVVVEYDGDRHRTSRERYEQDQRRIERLTDAGWRVIRIRSDALFRRPEEVVRRVSSALAR